MTGIFGGSAAAINFTTPLAGNPPLSALDMAKGLIAGYSDVRGGLNFIGLGEELVSLSARDPALGSLVTDHMKTLIGLHSFAKLMASNAQMTGASPSKTVPNPGISSLVQNAPVTSAERQLAQNYNLVDQRSLKLPAAKAEEANARAAYDGAVANGESQKSIAKKLTKLNEATAKREVIETRIASLQAIMTKIGAYIETQSFTVKAKDGTEQVRPFHGTKHEFATMEEAVDNAIATGYAYAAILGDNIERGGIVYRTDNGQYRFDIKLGSEGSSAWNNYKNDAGVKLYAQIDIGQPFVPHLDIPKNAVAQWHIHPKGHPDDANFSDAKGSGAGDIGSFKAMEKDRDELKLAPLQYFLGEMISAGINFILIQKQKSLSRTTDIQDILKNDSEDIILFCVNFIGRVLN